MPRVSKAVKALTTSTSEERLKRLVKQNEKLDLEIGKTKGELVELEQVRRYVFQCNSIVRTRFLSLPDKLAPRLVGLPIAKAAQELREAITSCLNELAYETGAKQHAETEPEETPYQEESTPDPEEEDTEGPDGYPDPETD